MPGTSPGMTSFATTPFTHSPRRCVSRGLGLVGVSSAMFEIGHFVLADQGHHARPEPAWRIQRFRPMPIQFFGPALAGWFVHLARMGLADDAGQETRRFVRLFGGQPVAFNL